MTSDSNEILIAAAAQRDIPDAETASWDSSFTGLHSVGQSAQSHIFTAYRIVAATGT